MSGPTLLSKDTKLIDKAWSDLMTAFTALRALVEEGGGQITMDIKVKPAKRKQS